MSTLYCIPCRQALIEGTLACPTCGGGTLACLVCHAPLVAGDVRCRLCERRELVRVAPERVEPEDARRSSDAVVALAQIPLAVTRVSKIVETYQGGSHGVKAEVKLPARDVEIMNELLQLAQLLHGLAARVNQFTGHTDHTRKLIRDMRSLASDAQEEVELRRGPA